MRRGFTRNLDERIEYFNEGKLYTTEVKLTSNCSLQCKYCYAESTPACTQSLPTEKIEELINDCAETGIKQMNWGGGEPLERKNWHELMRYTNEKGLENLLMTNGCLLHQMETAEKVANLVDMVFVHIDTLNLGIWKQLHGTNQELHQKQIDGIINLLDSGFPCEDVAISMTLTKQIFENEDYKKTLDWAYDELGVAAILFPYRNFGFAGQTMDFNPTFEQMAEAYKYRNGKDGIHSGPGFGTKFYCGTKCYVQAGGELMGCSMVYPTYVGNINKIRFKDLYLRNKDVLTYNKLHNPRNIKGHCSKCEHNTFCWGCRAASELIAGGFQKSDPICWVKKENDFDGF